MDSDSDTACAVGCPIRRSRDQRLLASPPGLSQRATSFIASQCQGIHQMPFISRLSTTPNGKDQACTRQDRQTEDAANLSLEDTCRTQSSFLSPKPRGPVAVVPDVPASVTSHSLLHPFNQQTHDGSAELRTPRIEELHAESRQKRARSARLSPPSKGWWR